MDGNTKGMFSCLRKSGIPSQANRKGKVFRESGLKKKGGSLTVGFTLLGMMKIFTEGLTILRMTTFTEA